MAEQLHTNVSVEFETHSSTDDLGPPAITLETDDIQAPYGFAYARLYYKGPTPSLAATSGYNVQTVNTNVTAERLEFLIFQGQAEVSLPTPAAGPVRLTPLGRLMTVKGDTVSSVGFVVDAARGTVKASTAMYGTVQVEYVSAFTRLLAQFREIPGADSDPRFASIFAPMVLVARQATGAPVSLSLTPQRKDQDPDKSKKDKVYGSADKSTGERIVLEIDTTFPIALSHTRPGTSGLTAVARVAVYSPRGGVAFVASQGGVEEDRYTLGETLEMTESLAFVGAQSVSVKYPPSNGVSISQEGASIVSEQTPGTTFHFVTAPYMVALADWYSYGTYLITGQRMVAANEVVATSSGVAVPVSGQVTANYSTRRNYVVVYWSRGSANWFTPVVLTARDAWGNVSSITISPPERRGR